MTRDAYFVVLVCANAYFVAVTLSNIVYLRRATRKARVSSGPFVSVVVPARNEERSIARCVASLLAQDYADYEVIVVDDDSSDATAAIVATQAAHDPRLRLIAAGSLPEGWLGKPHAMCRGAATARGDILIFTDADTVHEPPSISWAVTNMQAHDADLLSGYPRQEYGSLGEDLVVPTMYAMMLLLPLYLLPRTKAARLAFAIGQYVAVRREPLDAIGGIEAIGDSIVDDMSMAIRMKEFGYRNVFLDAKSVARCHMYSGYRNAFRGVERSIYSAVGGRPLTVVALAAIVLALIVGPAASVLMSGLHLEVPAGVLPTSVALFALQWALLAWDRDVPWIAAALYPVVFLNLILMMNASMLDTGFGLGVDWKGRVVRMPRDEGRVPEAQMADRSQ